MIKGVGQVHEVPPRPALFLCPDRENIRRLMNGDPIVFEAADLHLPPMRVILMYGADQDAITRQLAPLMRPGMALNPPRGEDQAVNWRAIATELCEAIEELPAVFTAAAGPRDNRLARARRQFHAAVEREGL